MVAVRDSAVLAIHHEQQATDYTGAYLAPRVWEAAQADAAARR
jgi:hypothetical protein